MNVLFAIIFTVAGLLSKNLEALKVGGLFSIASSIDILTYRISQK